MTENHKKQTKMFRHADSRHFSLQEWVELTQVIVWDIRTKLNLANTSTKALGWVLHNRHTGRMMGEYESTFMYIE